MTITNGKNGVEQQEFLKVINSTCKIYEKCPQMTIILLEKTKLH